MLHCFDKKTRKTWKEDLALARERSRLVRWELRQFIRDRGLTQVAAAERLGISQSRVSGLVPGKWERFNLEMLITLI